MSFAAGLEISHPDTALWTSDFFAAVEEYPLLSDHLCGVYAQDNLEGHLCQGPYPRIHIVNTDTSKQTGSHWIMLVQRRLGNLQFYDSYSLSPRLYGTHLAQYIRKHSYRRYGQVKHMYQSIDSVVCGYYVLYFMTRELLSHILPAIPLSTQAKHRRRNDINVLRWGLRHFPSLRHRSVKTGLSCIRWRDSSFC